MTEQSFPAMSGTLVQPQPAVAPAPKFWRRTAPALTAAALVAGLFGGVTGAVIASPDSPQAPPSVVAQTVANQSTTDWSSVAAKVLPSVVQVNVGNGLGSGVILTADGRILTNNHVVASAGGSVTVTLNDGREVPATVVSTDPSSDLAVLQASGVSGLTPITWADSDDVKIGDGVMAIGSPSGLQGTVTTGIVSALDRKVTVPGEGRRAASVSYQAIQTDASINPGNSGGALVNAAGELVGINSAIYSPASSSGAAGSVGIGFAIPSNTAKTIVGKLG
ncbi:S1C family serine protease [Nocardia sp. NRRL S-836]|uniref:S1C family serine protease n=1 Tax=Nocardia sp. NRRL S-836 TaxID=1519492 RepID=UPI0006AD9994|nr:trypsin-like peptidase domain-containing protein [Nocardia sp. NRRL S-836]KOV79238.1 peptidase S1 and S6 chymotrypsin/Hap [Nocardia sp. NRRL S-836]